MRIAIYSWMQCIQLFLWYEWLQKNNAFFYLLKLKTVEMQKTQYNQQKAYSTIHSN